MASPSNDNLQQADPHQAARLPISRRTLLVAGGLSFCGASLPELVQASAAGPAKSTILIWLSGGASHIDTWDMKPNAPSSIRGPFNSIPTTAKEYQLCEHLPKLAKQAHHLSVSVPTSATFTLLLFSELLVSLPKDANKRYSRFNKSTSHEHTHPIVSFSIGLDRLFVFR